MFSRKVLGATAAGLVLLTGVLYLVLGTKARPPAPFSERICLARPPQADPCPTAWGVLPRPVPHL